jgi:hypothetical protein
MYYTGTHWVIGEVEGGAVLATVQSTAHTPEAIATELHQLNTQHEHTDAGTTTTGGAAEGATAVAAVRAGAVGWTAGAGGGAVRVEVTACAPSAAFFHSLDGAADAGAAGDSAAAFLFDPTRKSSHMSVSDDCLSISKVSSSGKNTVALTPAISEGTSPPPPLP